MMNLTPTELERLTIFSAAELARRYRSMGIKLSHPEAVALISDEVLTGARRGMTYTDLVDFAGTLLTTDDVETNVASMISYIAVEACFAEGTKLVVIFEPIKPGALPLSAEPQPGEIIAGDGDIELNARRRRTSMAVLNTGDRAIQVRSHAHFFETNRALQFDRAAAFGMRLDCPSGTGMRFDPGVVTQAPLVEIGGSGTVRGFGQLTDGSIHDPAVKAAAIERARARGYKGA